MLHQTFFILITLLNKYLLMKLCAVDQWYRKDGKKLKETGELKNFIIINFMIQLENWWHQIYSAIICQTCVDEVYKVTAFSLPKQCQSMSHCNIWRKLFSRFNFKGCENQVKVNVMEAQSKIVQIWPYEKTKHFITTVIM